MKSANCWLLVIGGGILCSLGVWLATFFYAFPVLPGLTVTFWRDTLIFASLGGVGAALSACGMVLLRLVLFRRRLGRPGK